MINPRNMTGPLAVTPANTDWVTHVLPTGRIVSPVGTVSGTPNFATDIVPYGYRLAVLANGATKAETISIFDAKSLRKMGILAAYKKTPPEFGSRGVPALTMSRQNFFQGLATGPNGVLYAAGGDSNDIAAFTLKNNKPALLRRYPLLWQPFPKDQYPYGYQGHHIHQPRLFYPDAIAVGPAGKHLYVTGMLSNSLARMDLKTGQTEYLNVGPYPFAVTFADGGKRLVVSLWGGNAVAVVDPHAMKLLRTVRVGPPTGPGNTQAGVHPTALAAVPHGPNVFVALANVDRIAEVDTATLQVKGYINDSPYPHAPPAAIPMV
ncbi:YncE family protein [Acidithiobacillus sp.]